MAKNQTSFVKGDPRINRRGRPKLGDSISQKFQDALNEKLSGDYSQLDSIIDAIVKKALKGDLAAADWLIARGYGKLIERQEHVNLNKNYDFSNVRMEDRQKLLELIKSANGIATVPSDDTDTV